MRVSHALTTTFTPPHATTVMFTAGFMICLFGRMRCSQCLCITILAGQLLPVAYSARQSCRSLSLMVLIINT